MTYTQSEFVITVPSPYGAELAYNNKARTTLGVLIEIISQSNKFVVISSPYIYGSNKPENETLIKSLIAALERGVIVYLISTGSGIESFLSDYIPKRYGNLIIMRPKTNIENEDKLGSHAKFCIADGVHAYIGSANITGPGLSSNLEMGILVHDSLAKQITIFWYYLVEKEFFIKVK